MLNQFVNRALILCGLLAAAITFNANAVTVQVLNDGGFEATVGQPVQKTWGAGAIGNWAVGDPFSVVSSAGAITPLSGTKMLAIDTTSVLGDASGDIYQIVDVSAFAAEIDAGIVTAELSVFYNAPSATTAGLTLNGMETLPLNFNNFQPLVGTVDSFSVDGNPATWQLVTESILLPANIRYLAFGAHEATDAPIAYADNAVLDLSYTVIPLPASWLLLAPAVALFARRRTGAA